MNFDSTKIAEVLTYLCDEVGGDWLLAGGSLVCLKFDADRGTEDIDIMRIRHSHLSDEAAKNELFKWLIANGLGPEWVNAAMEPFVKAANGWESEIVEIKTGKKGRIFRPTLTLFTFLKLRRGTEIDLRDIVSARKSCPEKFDETKLKSWSNEAVWNRFQKVRKQIGF